MPVKKKLIMLSAVLISFTLTSFVAAADVLVARSAHVEASLIPEVQSIQPGHSFMMAVRLKMDHGWHTYWRNPGDSGLPTEIKWTLPEGFSAGDILWPVPEKIDTPPLVTFGYHDEIYLLTEIQVAENVKAGESVNIKAKVDWLECEDVCIPGGVELSITMDVSTQALPVDGKIARAFSDARAALSIKQSEWQFAVKDNGDKFEIQAQAPSWFDSELGTVIFFPFEFGVTDYLKPQDAQFSNGRLTLIVEKADADVPLSEIEGILVSQNGWRGPGSEKAHYIKIETGSGLPGASHSLGSGLDSIFYALIFSFIGGMILNLMPCVLPVLSLKIMGFVQQANEDKSQAWKHGAVFTLGVLFSFWVLAGILLFLRAGGEQLGWGFQLQEPVFLIILSAFLFLFGLSMFGVFEIGTSLTTIEGKTGRKSGWLGSFVSGITATVVATPCTAPFMGSALGFALTQPEWVSMSIFTFLGLGMAFPYVLLASIPSLLKFVPKPGRWMESMKQFMGFLLVATVLWLLWVLAQQAGAMMVIVVLACLLVLSIAGWIYGRWGNLAMPQKARTTSTIIAVVVTVVTLFLTIDSIDTFATTAGETSFNSQGEGIAWQAYSDDLVENLRSSGQAVFIDFTAAWCLSCQVNERVTFTSIDVQEKFKELNITPLKADWTSRDETITKALASYGRNSVPLYVYYPLGKNQEPILLPELITPGIVIGILEENGTQNLSIKN